MYQNQALLKACYCYYYYYSVLGRVSVGERGREDGQRVREDEHAADDDADAADEAPVVVSGDVTVAGLRHGDDGEVQRQDVALAGRQHRRVGALGQPARPVAAAVPSIRAPAASAHQRHQPTHGQSGLMLQQWRHVKTVKLAHTRLPSVGFRS